MLQSNNKQVLRPAKAGILEISIQPIGRDSSTNSSSLEDLEA
jgi:hypothetical protein